MTTEENSPTPSSSPITVGVLALQGSFREHSTALRRLPGVTAIEVRSAEELSQCDGLVIPGGESTTMALVAERWGLVGPLKEYSGSGKPLWGTCAGLIFLANRAVGMKEGGQALLGGLDALVSRNFFGAQADSFEATLPPPACLEPFSAAAGSAAAGDGSSSPSASASPGFRAVFIRAPAVLETGPGVEVLAELELTDEQVEGALRSRAAGSGNSGGGGGGGGSGGSGGSSDPAAADAPSVPRRVAVAVRQGNLLATSFHPELTDDSRWHALFAEATRQSARARRGESGGEGGGEDGEVSEAGAGAGAAAAADGACKSLGRKVQLPADLPVLAPGQKYGG